MLHLIGLMLVLFCLAVMLPTHFIRFSQAELVVRCAVEVRHHLIPTVKYNNHNAQGLFLHNNLSCS